MCMVVPRRSDRRLCAHEPSLGRTRMSDHPERLRRILEAIDAANARDPHVVEVERRQVPAEWLYGQRMSTMLAGLVPNASDALTIAARVQHIERWTSPRTAYPEGRTGYLQ